MRIWLLVCGLLAAIVGGIAVAGSDDKPLKVGDKAPEFALPWATADKIELSNLWKLSDHDAKKPVVVAFYPADFSGGCTKQMCSYRDDFKEIEGLGVELAPISGDYVFSHQAWCKQEKFPFALLSDHLHKVAAAYGSYNADYGWNIRTVFLVDTKGNIRYIDWHYNPMADSPSFPNLKAAIRDLKKT